MKTPSKKAVTIAKDLITLTDLCETLEEKHEIIYQNFLKRNNYNESDWFLIDEKILNKNGLLEVNEDLTKVNEVINLKMEKENEAIDFLLNETGVTKLTKIQKESFTTVYKYRKTAVKLFLSYYTQFINL